jgi:YYY domain-containing protein
MLGLFDGIVWLVIVQLLAFAVLPYVAWMSPSAPDRGYGWSKVLGVFLFAWAVWLESLFGLSSDNNYLVVFTFVVFLVIGFRGYYSGWLSLSDLKTLFSKSGRQIESLFIGLTLFYGIIRFCNPEIFWGEKPMDSTFLNFFTRNDALPPQDPWAVGSPMSYYYLGIYFIAAILKLTGIPAAVGYNLAMATLAGWIGSALFSLIILLTKNARFAWWSVWLLLLASNPEALRLTVMKPFQMENFSFFKLLEQLNFDSVFWASTRVFVSPSFLEYTSWSLLFADLHAHVVSICFTVTALGLATLLFLDGSTRYSGKGVTHRLILGAVVGSLFGINTWDFISFGAVVGALIVMAQVPFFWKPPVKADGAPILGEVLLVGAFSRSVALVWDLVLFGASAALFVGLYRYGVSFRPAGGWGWVSSHEFNPVIKLLRVMGYWLVGLLVSVGVVAWSRWRSGKALPVLHILVALILGMLALVPGILSAARGLENHPWTTFAYVGVLVASAYLWLWATSASAEMKALSIFVAAAGYLIVMLEVFFLLDRMNTLFKGYMAVWMLSAIGTVVGAFFAYQKLREYGSARVQAIARWTGYVVVAAILLGTCVNVFAICKLKRVPTRFYTLDGIAYLRAINPSDAAVIDWLNEHVKGNATVVEAHGEAYREYTRISMHTGLSTVLGWEHHTKQRGLSPEGAIQRRKAIQAIYVSEDVETTKNLLLEYHVDFVVIGAVERATYRRMDESKFDNHPELFTKVGTFGDTSLYVTYFSKFNSLYGSRKTP